MLRRPQGICHREQVAQVLVLPSVLGVRAGVLDAVERLQTAGHTAHLADIFRGRSFDTYPEARAFAGELGNEELDRRALEAAADLPDDLVAVGFSLGAVLAERIALHQPVAGVVLLSGALSVRSLDSSQWPRALPLQLHVAVEDPLRNAAQINDLLADASAAGASATLFDYAGGGHLFTDPTLPDEYSADAASLAWRRILDFVGATTGHAPQ